MSNNDYDIWQYNKNTNSIQSDESDSSDLWRHSSNTHIPQLSQELNSLENSMSSNIPDLTLNSNSNLELAEPQSLVTIDESQILALNQVENHHIVTLNSVHSTCSDKPYLTFDSQGIVYRHDTDGNYHEVGRIKNNTYYNLEQHELGYLRDGCYYDSSNNEKQGSICAGNVYDNNHKKIATADTSTEGGAWIAFIEHGGLA